MDDQAGHSERASKGLKDDVYVRIFAICPQGHQRLSRIRNETHLHGFDFLLLLGFIAIM